MLACLPRSRAPASNWRRLRQDSRGLAALEFALLAPVLICLVLGIAVMTSGFRADMLLTSTASSMSNIVATQTSVTSSTLQDFCKGVQLTMQPYDLTRLSVSVGGYTVRSGVVVKDWEYDMAPAGASTCQGGGTALGAAGLAAAASFLTPASGPPSEGDSAVVARANYSFLGFSYTIVPAISAGVPNLALTHTDVHRVRGLVAPSGTATAYSGAIACTAGC